MLLTEPGLQKFIWSEGCIPHGSFQHTSKSLEQYGRQLRLSQSKHSPRSRSCTSPGSPKRGCPKFYQSLKRPVWTALPVEAQRFSIRPVEIRCSDAKRVEPSVLKSIG